MLRLGSCAKAYTKDQDKACPPEQTVARVREVLENRCQGVLAETRRVDTGRLGIPVFLSNCGPRARSVMPTRKQMGKGASPIQAEASALMELVERFSYFSFWADESNFTEATWSEAAERWPDSLMDISLVLRSVNEELDPEDAVRLMDLVRWRFCPVLDVAGNRQVIAPLDWFKTLNEFNGSSAGNTPEESILQGACELVERHVSAVIDRTSPELPTIDPASIENEVLKNLCDCFERNGVRLILKDFSLGFPVPTVGALAWDPVTFPGMSEIVYTAGTAASPVKASIRAVTEIAQLAGDFETGRVYEASGLRKFTSRDQFRWLERGPVVPLSDLPDIEAGDIYAELLHLAREQSAMGYPLFTVDTRQPDLKIPANYNFVPGFDFRERTPNASIGMFVGRILAEEVPELEALVGLETLAEVYPDAPFLPFFQGRLALRMGDADEAARRFAEAEPLQPGLEEGALCAFYQAYALSQQERWAETVPLLDRAIGLDAEVKEFFNLRGVARFKAGEYREAAENFQAALNLDNGSAADLANLGLCHKFLGENEAAHDFLTSALELDPALDWAQAQLDELTKSM